MNIAHRFVPHFEKVGLPLPLAQAMSERAWDLGSFHNITNAQTVERLVAGVSGEVDPVRGFGVELAGDDPSSRAESILHQTEVIAGDFGLIGG